MGDIAQMMAPQLAVVRPSLLAVLEGVRIAMLNAAGSSLGTIAGPVGTGVPVGLDAGNSHRGIVKLFFRFRKLQSGCAVLQSFAELSL